MYTKNTDAINIVKNIMDLGRVTITSRELAKITNKNHRMVLRNIREEIERLTNDGINTDILFSESTWRNGRGRVYPQYQISSQGILHILARYGRYNYQLRYDLMEIASSLDYHLFRRWGK